MRAAVLRRGQIVVDDVPEPVPGPGQVLLEVLACGICGTDLHARRHAEEFVAASRACGMATFDWDTGRDVVMGHEMAARVLALGADVEGVRVSQRVVPAPIVRVGGRAHSVGYSNDYPGGYAERVVVDAAGLVPIPTGADARHCALSEPLAVGLHAVNASHVGGSDVGAGASAVVLGCGPVGLATIAALHVRGVPLIVAADFSPARRALAASIGAHVVVDPAAEEPVPAWRAAGGRGSTVIFEAVGVPGMIDAAMRAAPRRSQVVVVGLCMPTDSMWPAVGVNKELTISFVLGWTNEELHDSLLAIAEGRVDVAPLVTGEVDLDGVAGAFDALARPENHAKILVRPNGPGA